ncbi:hypothetical protein [Streptomyces sp. NPDC058457]|uniref:hypothetical protein n=1 Tax=Streptomyces sp. NPDC058457 TaxID=3346507 RepID=UPI00365282B9
MPAKDELARRRYEKLVDRLEGLMRASLKPRHQGYHGQLILSSGDLEEMGELAAGDTADAVDAELRGGA